MPMTATMSWWLLLVDDRFLVSTCEDVSRRKCTGISALVKSTVMTSHCFSLEEPCRGDGVKPSTHRQPVADTTVRFCGHIQRNMMTRACTTSKPCWGLDAGAAVDTKQRDGPWCNLQRRRTRPP